MKLMITLSKLNGDAQRFSHIKQFLLFNKLFETLYNNLLLDFVKAITFIYAKIQKNLNLVD